MDPELEALLKSYDAFMEARGGSNEGQLFALYQSRLDDVAAARRLGRETLDAAVRTKYPRWIRAGHHPSSLPPKA
jgi:hypothetical protein